MESVCDSKTSQDVGAEVEQFGSTPLINAIRWNNNELALELIGGGEDVNVKDAYYVTPLIHATTENNTVVVTALIQAKCDVNAFNNHYATALHLAVQQYNYDIAELLIKSGANVNESCQSKNGSTPLMLAVESKILRIINAPPKACDNVNEYNRNACMASLLINSGANVDAKDDAQETALFKAARNSNVEVIKVLIDAGASIDARDHAQETALFNAARNSNVEVIKVLIDAGASIDARDEIQQTALFEAARKSNKEVIKVLINAGASIDARDFVEDTALFSAAINSDVEVIKVLIDAGASIDARDQWEETALFSAARNSNVEVIKVLIDASAIIDARNEREETALFIAAENSNVEFIKVLINAGASIDARNYEQETALFNAARNSNVEVIKVLINAGASIDARNDKQETALFNAARNSNVEVIKVLINAGASIDARDVRQETALFNAARNSNVEVIKVLIQNRKVNINARDQYGRTPIFYTFTGNHHVTQAIETLRLLLENGAQINDTDSYGLSMLSYCIEKVCIYDMNSSTLIQMLDILKTYGQKQSIIFLAIINVLCLKLISTSHTIIFPYSFLFTTDLAMKYSSRKHENKLHDLRVQLQSLHEIKQEQLPEILNLLMQLGADPKGVDSQGNTALHYAAAHFVLGSSERLSMEIISKLEKHGARFDTKNRDNQTPLMYGLATWAEDRRDFLEFKAMKAVCEHMVEIGCPLVNEISRNGESFFHVLMRLFRKVLTNANEKILGEILQDLIFILKLLCPPHNIQKGTVNRRDNMLRSPLHLWASLSLQQDKSYTETISGKMTFENLLIEIFNHLRACGIQLNARDAEDQTPLHYCRTWSAVKCLVEAGAKPNYLDNKERPPLLATAHNKVFNVKAGCFFADVEDEPKSFYKQCIDMHLDLWSDDDEGKSILSLLLSSDCFALAEGLVEAACEPSRLRLDKILLILCDDQETHTFWKSTLVGRVLLCPKRPDDLSTALRRCCKTIKKLYYRGEIELRKDVSRSTINGEDTRTSKPASVHLEIVRQLLLYDADGKSLKGLYSDIPQLHYILTKEVEWDQTPLSIPWTSCSNNHKEKLERVARRQNVDSMNTYWYHKEPIGSGAFGDVFAGICQKDGREIAIKKIVKRNMNRPQDKREITNLATLADCAQIVNYIYYDNTDNNFAYVVLELMEGNLDEYFESYVYDSRHSFSLCKELVMGVKYLHNHKPDYILHRDLKPGNILYKVHPKLCLKIADFGLSRSMNASGTTVLGSHAGTRSWIAPDVISSSSFQHTRESDMYSCGLLLHYILSPKRHPFSPVDCSNQSTEMIELKTRTNMLNGSMEGWDDKISAEAAHLIKPLLSRKPEERPSADDSLPHPLFWTKKKKLDFLYAVGNQPEIERPAVYGPHLQSDIETSFSRIVKYRTWNNVKYTDMPNIYAEMKKHKRYDTGSIIHLLRFIRNAISHVSEASRPNSTREHILEDAVFLEYFPNLVMEVYQIVIVQHGWDERLEIKHVMLEEDL